MKLIAYQAPKWVLENHLVQKYYHHVVKRIPSHRIELVSRNPTPLDKMVVSVGSAQSILPPGYEVWIKRDDLTHHDAHMQGNKLRKLEFLFADALAQNARHVLTAGGLQSNHCRTVAAVAARLGLRAHLFLRSPHSDANKIALNGNLLIDMMLGSNVYLIERGALYYESIEPKMKILASKLEEPAYLIPIGGSNLIGLWGYVEMFNELLSQNANEICEDICVTCGSGGTMSGLAIANFLTGSKFQLHAFCVCDSSAYFYAHLEDHLKELFGPESHGDLPKPTELVNIVQCSKGIGYGKSTSDELNFQIEFLKTTGIMLDPVYVGKMFYALFNLLQRRKPTLEYEKEIGFADRLRGKKLLVLHTGGHLANFESSRFDDLYKRRDNMFDCFGEKIDSIELSKLFT